MHETTVYLWTADTRGYHISEGKQKSVKVATFCSMSNMSKKLKEELQSNIVTTFKIQNIWMIEKNPSEKQRFILLK